MNPGTVKRLAVTPGRRPVSPGHSLRVSSGRREPRFGESKSLPVRVPDSESVTRSRGSLRLGSMAARRRRHLDRDYWRQRAGGVSGDDTMTVSVSASYDGLAAAAAPGP